MKKFLEFCEKKINDFFVSCSFSVKLIVKNKRWEVGPLLWSSELMHCSVRYAVRLFFYFCILWIDVPCAINWNETNVYLFCFDLSHHRPVFLAELLYQFIFLPFLSRKKKEKERWTGAKFSQKEQTSDLFSIVLALSFFNKYNKYQTYLTSSSKSVH